MDNFPLNIKFQTKKQLTDIACKYMNYRANYFITLEAFSTRTSKEFIESAFNNWGRRMHKYCYGRKHRRDEARLKIVGGLERSLYSEKWHVHCAVGFGEDCLRSEEGITQQAHYHWYELLNANGRCGNLVNVKPITNLEDAFKYAFWDSTMLQTTSGEYGVLFA